MVAYSFRKRFVAPIRAGLGLIGMMHEGREVPAELTIDDATGKVAPFDPLTDIDPPVHPKRQTIRTARLGRSRHARPGETLQLYCAMRTKQCFSIGVARCVSVAGIRIQVGLGIISIDDYPAIRDGDLDAFAQSDGFADWADMRAFWQEEHGEDLKRLGPFVGVMIRWEPLT